jgi:hypothetical protein
MSLEELIELFVIAVKHPTPDNEYIIECFSDWVESLPKKSRRKIFGLLRQKSLVIGEIH